MTMRKFKLFMAWEHEKEEQWLAEMEAQGWHFKKYSLLGYEFEKGEPNTYQYRLELLPNMPSHPESIRYLEFMEDMGVEMVDSYLRWVYFRKAWSDEPFEVYSDAEHRIRHLRGIQALLLPVLVILLVNLANITRLAPDAASFAALPVLILMAAFAVAALKGILEIRAKIARLEQERKLHE